MNTTHDADLAAWATEQAALLRAGRLEELDTRNVAKEIARLGRAELRCVGNSVTHVMAWLLVWQSCPARRSWHWRAKIVHQRIRVRRHTDDGPSLAARMRDDAWLATRWRHALKEAWRWTGRRARLPECLPWSLDQLLDLHFLPDASAGAVRVPASAPPFSARC